MIDVLVLAAALAQQAPKDVETAPGVWTTVTTADGQRRLSAGFHNPRWRTEALTYYLVAKPTACVTSATPRKPDGEFDGWAVEIGPGPNGPKINWTRFQKSGSPVSASRTLLAASRATLVLDEWPNPPGGERCEATVWSIESRIGPPTPHTVQNLVEAELWFVHKSPDGKETSQKQTVRMRPNSQTDFYFDDIVVNASIGDRTEPITVEVYGSMVFDRLPAGDQLWSRLFLTRRYINPKAAALGLPPTVGKGTHDVTVSPGEVVSFVLPPIEKDTGQFVGHRFSVRVRIKQVG